jgi:WD40-like Beta Propeller Repeat
LQGRRAVSCPRWSHRRSALPRVTALATWVLTRPAPPAPAPPMRFAIPAPEKTTLANSLSLSPDGRHLAFMARAGGQNQIWVRSLDTMDARFLTGSDNFTGFFWSPDSRFIAFGGNGKLRRVEASGGPAQTVCDLAGAWRGGAWSPDGTIIIGIDNRLMRVPAAGGEPAPITAGDPTYLTFSPSFLPDGRHFLFGRETKNGSDIYVGSLDATAEQQFSKRLLTTSEPRAPVFAPSPDPNVGYVLWEREGSLVAQPFDLRRLEVVGSEIPIMNGILSSSRPRTRRRRRVCSRSAPPHPEGPSVSCCGSTVRANRSAS